MGEADEPAIVGQQLRYVPLLTSEGGKGQFERASRGEPRSNEYRLRRKQEESDTAFALRIVEVAWAKSSEQGRTSSNVRQVPPDQMDWAQTIFFKNAEAYVRDIEERFNDAVFTGQTEEAFIALKRSFMFLFSKETAKCCPDYGSFDRKSKEWNGENFPELEERLLKVLEGFASGEMSVPGMENYFPAQAQIDEFNAAYRKQALIENLQINIKNKEKIYAEVFDGLVLGTLILASYGKPKRTEALIEALEGREKRQALPLRDDFVFFPGLAWLRPRQAFLKATTKTGAWRRDGWREYTDNSLVEYLGLTPLSWGEPVETLRALLERNSFLLSQACDDIVGRIGEAFNGFESYKNEPGNQPYYRSGYIGSATSDAESAMKERQVLADLRQQVVEAIAQDHPQAEMLQDKLQKIDETLKVYQLEAPRNTFFKEQAAEKRKLRAEFKRQMAELDKETEQFEQIHAKCNAPFDENVPQAK